MTNKDIKFPQMLRYYRQQKGLTMKQLAKEMGKTESAISRWESGDNSPKMADIIDLAGFLEVDIDLLIYGAENKEFIDHFSNINDLTISDLELIREIKNDKNLSLDEKMNAARSLIESNLNYREELSIHPEYFRDGVLLTDKEREVYDNFVKYKNNIPLNIDEFLRSSLELEESFWKDGTYDRNRENPAFDKLVTFIETEKRNQLIEKLNKLSSESYYELMKYVDFLISKQ
ncbi:helix-turn-helix domain-containing protein [Lactococcus lactis subsp. lactis]|uniref:helix-turn-helix domain-containing protein n=1 Tax=Lactococcus lactis TaxID=1358 RepID=UPI0026497667|nr:helix-turn-helix domain-containing protein [Lactococcus lactis]MDT2857115.1 helix-turn-helix domain-containing protein [Lactococcus lactis]WKB49603.1 helix-turn-helix domain-containing protein [Lactococcus lactis subsp. lactis]